MHAVCERCLELEEKIHQLNDLLGYRFDLEEPRYALTPTEWRIFRALEDAKHPLRLERLIALLDREPDEYVDAALHARVVISKIRQKIRSDGLEIQPVLRQGYVLVNRREQKREQERAA